MLNEHFVYFDFLGNTWMILERSQSNCLSQHVTRQWSVEIAFIDILKHLFDNDDNVIVFDCDRLKRITKHFVRDWRKVILFSFVNLNIDWNFLLDLRLVLLLCVSEEIYSFFQQSLKQQTNFVRSLSSNKHIYWLHLVRSKKNSNETFGIFLRWHECLCFWVEQLVDNDLLYHWIRLERRAVKKKRKSPLLRDSRVCVCVFSPLCLRFPIAMLVSFSSPLFQFFIWHDQQTRTHSFVCSLFSW